MRVKLMVLFAAAALLAACSQDAKTGMSDAGSGSSASSSQSGMPAAGSKEELVAEIGDRVFFDYDKSDVSAEGQETLNRQAVWLAKYPNVRVTIEGHCDERGTREYNLALGDRRANAVRDYLIARGVDAGRVKTISYGKERPVAFGSGQDAWAQNRRGVTEVN